LEDCLFEEEVKREFGFVFWEAFCFLDAEEEGVFGLGGFGIWNCLFVFMSILFKSGLLIVLSVCSGRFLLFIEQIFSLETTRESIGKSRAVIQSVANLLRL